MQRINRMFEVIQLLRAATGPVKAEDLADQMEVSKRTIYRDIAALQARGTPIEGEAGIGYMMRRGYDLPPLNFDPEEVEALRVGLRMLMRTGDNSLQKAAERVCDKIDALHEDEEWLQVSPWGAPFDDPNKGCVSKAEIRDAIRNAKKLRLTYRDEEGNETERTIRPVGMIYHTECVMVGAWCEMRNSFRHFRSDRIWCLTTLEETFAEQAPTLRALWVEQHGYGAEDFAEARGVV